MQILRLMIRVLVFVAMVIWLMEVLNNLRFGTNPRYDPTATARMGFHRNSQDKPDHDAYILEFINAVRPILLRVIESLRVMRKLDSGTIEIDGPEDLIEWYSLSRIARDKARDDQKRLSEFEDDKLGEHATAKQLLMRILSAEIRLWLMYDEYLRVKFEIKDTRLEKEIAEKLSSELFEFSQKCDSLRAFYNTALLELEAEKRSNYLAGQ